MTIDEQMIIATKIVSLKQPEMTYTEEQKQDIITFTTVIYDADSEVGAIEQLDKFLASKQQPKLIPFTLEKWIEQGSRVEDLIYNNTINIVNGELLYFGKIEHSTYEYVVLAKNGESDRLSLNATSIRLQLIDRSEPKLYWQNVSKDGYYTGIYGNEEDCINNQINLFTKRNNAYCRIYSIKDSEGKLIAKGVKNY